MRITPRRGFTLIELLIVVVIIGILAAIAIPNFKTTKGRAYVTTMRTDLRNLSTAQESYFYDNGSYSTSLASIGFSGSAGVVLTVTEASISGWSATATHPQADSVVCAVFYGSAAAQAPATQQGAITCK